jgi:hypothetical protein
MGMTVASNEHQSQAQLLRHGMLNWVTCGVFLGYQRNYLELQVDDLCLCDDAWDPAPSAHQAGLVPGAAFIVTVIAIACCAAPLAASLGGGVVDRGLMLALPLMLALQWGLQSRYLNHPQGWRSSPAGAGGSCWVRLPSRPPRLGSSASPACSPAC